MSTPATANPLAVCQGLNGGSSERRLLGGNGSTPACGTHTSQPHSSTRLIRTGTMAARAYAAKSSCSTEPMSMFCGLPMSVAADPMLAAHARPSRNGSGLVPRRRHSRATIGVIARHTTSFENTADNTAATAMSAASSAASGRGNSPTRRVTAA
jgi:hypothetical protein